MVVVSARGWQLHPSSWAPRSHSRAWSAREDEASTPPVDDTVDGVGTTMSDAIVPVDDEGPNSVAATSSSMIEDSTSLSEADDDVESALDALQFASTEESASETRESASESDSLIDKLQPTEAELMERGVIRDARIGLVASHELVDTDEDGDPLVDSDRMVFVDEASCIGCTNCACIAPSTFMMEDDYGRARVFQQDGDTEETIAEAIATCPVDCIHYVPWDELVSLELKRENVMTSYNFKGRLVGSDGLRSTAGAGAALLDISSNNAARCPNCPTNKCPECPMFSVGDDAARDGLKTRQTRKRCGNCPTNGCVGCPLALENPEFQKRRARRETKRRQRIKARRDDILREMKDSTVRPVDL
ncbi:hypothetical protein CTAYLR_010761 [Chrysophaeum taylorii]|uniref:4Fe-4S ferredoxin-type domain-containing protein n=1 Tax=Chrysophaeum taylorii TaxID=2483200 RepID=A0AAD7U603_9STRA|nr:hypothetical protein CTAYLR_010761 [Chrysophaeum taylorii]